MVSGGVFFLVCGFLEGVEMRKNEMKGFRRRGFVI